MDAHPGAYAPGRCTVSRSPGSAPLALRGGVRHSSMEPPGAWGSEGRCTVACEITAPTIRLKIHSHVECSHLGDLQQSEARACTRALTVSRAAAALQRRHGACAPDAHSGSHAHCRPYFDAHDTWLGARVCVGARTCHLNAPFAWIQHTQAGEDGGLCTGRHGGIK